MAGAGTQQQVASVATQADSSPSYKPVTAVAAAADEQPSLMARARAAAAKGSSMTQHAGGSMEEEEDQPGKGGAALWGHSCSFMMAEAQQNQPAVMQAGCSWTMA